MDYIINWPSITIFFYFVLLLHLSYFLVLLLVATKILYYNSYSSSFVPAAKPPTTIFQYHHASRVNNSLLHPYNIVLPCNFALLGYDLWLSNAAIPRSNPMPKYCFAILVLPIIIFCSYPAIMYCLHTLLQYYSNNVIYSLAKFQHTIKHAISMARKPLII